MILLTDEEIKGFVRGLTGVGLGGIEYRTEYDIDGLLKAQLKKVVEWLKEPCDCGHSGWYVSTRNDCPYCRQALLKEME